MMGRLWQDEAQPLTRVRPSPPLLRQCAFVSERTYELCAALRRRGVLLAIVTGARAGTLLQRAPLLPAADAYACENGGRIFLRGAGGAAPGAGAQLPASGEADGTALLVEDAEWRERMDAVCGSAGEVRADALTRAAV